MEQKLSRLVFLLEEAASLLRSHDENHWASWIGEDLIRLKAEDYSGAAHFLKAFGGMGSINDLILSPLNGHLLTEPETAAANEKLRSLLAEARELAEQVNREANPEQNGSSEPLHP
ncbi:hypothetical protein JW906_15290 [bacterium]|nr:hypothetical protein [bacterium]